MIHTDLNPNRQNLAICRSRKNSATYGHETLKKKADAIKQQIIGKASKVDNLEAEISTAASNSYIGLSRAHYEIRSNHISVLDDPEMKPTFRLISNKSNISGVRVERFTWIYSKVLCFSFASSENLSFDVLYIQLRIQIVI